MPAEPTMPTDAYSCLQAHTRNSRQRNRFFWGGVYGIGGTIPFQNPVHLVLYMWLVPWPLQSHMGCQYGPGPPAALDPRRNPDNPKAPEPDESKDHRARAPDLACRGRFLIFCEPRFEIKFRLYFGVSLRASTNINFLIVCSNCIFLQSARALT